MPRFDRWQSISLSQVVVAEPVAHCFSITVLSRGSCYGKYISTLLLKYSFNQAWFKWNYKIYVSISCFIQWIVDASRYHWLKSDFRDVIHMSSAYGICCILWCDVCDCRLLPSISIGWCVVLVDVGHHESLLAFFGCITAVICWYITLIFECCLFVRRLITSLPIAVALHTLSVLYWCNER